MNQGPIQILLIEDNPGDARLIEEMVAEVGGSLFVLKWVNQLAAGLDSLEADQVDIVLLDLSLPDSHGFETLTKVRERAPKLPIIVLTGLDDGTIAIQAMQEGAQNYIVKGKVDSTLLERSIIYAIERQKLTEALQEREARYKDLADSISEVFFAMDKELRCTYWNKASERLTGILAKEAIGKSCYKIFPILGKTEMEHFFLEVLERNQAKILETECRINSKVFFFEINAYPSQYGLSIFGKDITERKESERELITYRSRLEDLVKERTAELMVANKKLHEEMEERKQLEQKYLQSQKMEAIGRLAGGVAHDLNNILTAFMGHIELLLLREDLKEDLLRHVMELSRSSERAAGLTRQLLAFSRKQMLKPKVIDLNKLITDIDEMLRRLIGENIGLIKRLDPQLGKVLADPSQMEQVVLNLVVNARDALPQGGMITIVTSNVERDEKTAGQHVHVHMGRYVVLEVCDNGLGMDEETIAHVFEPFFTTKETGKGTGLGLSTVYGIVKQSGGHITVRSEIGQGTTFRICLPLIDMEAEPIAKEEEVAESLKGDEMIMIVEDDDLVRSITVEIVTNNGYRVIEARESIDALRLCKQHDGTIDLLLTDVVMPGMSGYKLAERVTALYPDIKVMFTSGYTQDVDSHHTMQETGALLVQKPFKPVELLRKIREVLDSP